VYDSCADTERIGGDNIVVKGVEGLPELLKGNGYDIVIIVFDPVVGADHINAMLEGLEESNVVYIDSLYESGGGILGMLIPVLLPGEYRGLPLRPLAVGFRVSSVDLDKLGRLDRTFIIHRIVMAMGSFSIRRVARLSPHSESRGSIVGDVLSLLSLTRELGELQKILRFALVGVLIIIMSESILWLLTDLFGFVYYVSAPIAYQITIFISFLLNELLVFRGAKRRGLLSRLVGWNIASWVSSAISLILLVVLKEFLGLHYLIANFIAMAAGSIFIFLISFNVVWVSQHMACIINEKTYS